LAWPLADDVTDDALRPSGRAGNETPQPRRVEPNWARPARDLKRPGVTMSIFWEEYAENNRAMASTDSAICFATSSDG
jgi:transposase